MTNLPAVQRPTTYAQMGQIGGRAAGELFLFHFIQKTQEGIRLALQSKLEEAKVEANTLLTSDNSDDRLAAEYWLSFYSERGRHVAKAAQ
jgi:hypothetical protein